nr:MAG: putative RNA-dependent RNA polymerase [Mitoviridae sp.]UJQ92623.1 MAG: putative RNA-dependent RNA polymerase [Mitoviridae sp.]
MIKDRVCQHLRSVGYDPKESSRYANLVQKWCNQSGMEWTVERLKALKVSFQKSLETGEYTLPEHWATRINRSGKTIVRDGFVHRVLSSPNEGKNLLRKEAFLRIYQVIKLDEPSKKQILKMKSAILGDSTANESKLKEMCSSLWVRHVDSGKLEKILAVGETSKTLPQMLGSSHKRSPAYVIPEGLRATKVKLVSTQRDDINVAKWIDYFAIDRQTNEFWERYPEFVGDRLLGPGRPAPVMTYPEEPKRNLQAGTLSVIQEGGAKARWVANPFLALQALGEPLKDKLSEYTKLAYTDVVCTYDQDRGYDTVVKWLQQGLKVWSFDASSFTDRFPLELQLTVLHQLQAMGVATEADVESFKLVVQKPWKCGVIGQDVVWTVGQPLGYGPSFHLATLTHAAVVKRLDMMCSPPYNMFRIVGDDIVIANEQLASAYEEAMASFGVDINRQKSLISNEYAEFLGKMISKEGVNPSIKVKLLISSDQIVDTLKFYGMNGLKWLTPPEKERAYRAYLPADLGGLDWRLPGLSYKEWLLSTPQGTFASKRLVKDVTAFYGREALSGASDVEREINRRIEYYSINGYDLSASEWARLGVVGELNGLTNLPVAKAHTDVCPLPSIGNDFVSLLDMVTKLSNREENLHGLPEKSGTSLASLLRNTHVSISEHGYLNETEKPYTGQSVIEVHNEQQHSPAERVRKSDVFTEGEAYQWDAEDPQP